MAAPKANLCPWGNRRAFVVPTAPWHLVLLMKDIVRTLG